MRYEMFLAMRYLGGLRRRQPFVSVIACVSTLGVALGVATLLVVLGVMTGFDADLQSKIIGANPHLTVEASGGITEVDSLLAALKEIPQVKAASPFLQAQVLLQKGESTTGVILRGVDPVAEPNVTTLIQQVGPGGWPPGRQGIVVGSELARRWGLTAGDSITVVVGAKKPVQVPVQVAGEFTSGMYDYDLHLTLASLETVQGLLGVPGTVSGVGLRVHDPLQAPAVKEILRRRLGYPYRTMTWMDLNQPLFAALALEKLTMFVILTLIVAVACFNVIATLLMMVVEKTQEVGILKSLGATSRSIRFIFTSAGLIIGALGTALGTALGAGLCWALKKYQFIQLPASVYYIDRMPVKLELLDLASVAAAAVALSWAACLYPAWVAGRMQPVEALRYE